MTPPDRASEAIWNIGTELSCISGYSLCRTASTKSARHVAADIATVSSSTPRWRATPGREGMLVVVRLVGDRRVERDHAGLLVPDERRHEARVDPAGEERSHRHVRHQPPPDGAAKLVLDHAGQRGARLARERGQPLAVDERCRVEPPPLGGGQRLEVDGERRPGQHALDPRERRRAAVGPAVDDRVGDDVGLRQARHPGGKQGAHLAGEPQRAAMPCPVERLDAPAVAREEQPSAVAVERRQAEQAVEAGRRVVAPPRESLEHGLGVRVAVPGGRLELPSQLQVVEDLAVVREGPTPVPMDHWLVTGRGRVHDREPPVDETHVALDRDPLVVRAAMRERRAHPF